MARKNHLPAHPVSFGSRRKMWAAKLSEVDEAISSGALSPQTLFTSLEKLFEYNDCGQSPVARNGKSDG